MQVSNTRPELAFPPFGAPVCKAALASTTETTDHAMAALQTLTPDARTLPVHIETCTTAALKRHHLDTDRALAQEHSAGPFAHAMQPIIVHHLAAVHPEL